MSILVDAFKLKPAQAIAFLKKKGMKISWNWFDTWKEAHTKAFTVAKCMKADILQDIRSMIQKAQNEGIPFEQFKRELAPRLQEKGWWGRKEIVDQETGEITEIQEGSVHRLKIIYQTNLQTSYMAGRYQGQMQSSMPYLQYISILDGQTTDRCRSLHLKVFAKDDPIWDHLYPPNHWGCRSRVRSLTKTKLERDNLQVESSSNKLVKKEVSVGGKSVSVTGYKLPEGNTFWPDPGWDYNPGKSSFKPDLNRYDNDIKNQLKKDLE
jgi:SPP1 gp7 family putative phage head morphogenesis protein